MLLAIVVTSFYCASRYKNETYSEHHHDDAGAVRIIGIASVMRRPPDLGTWLQHHRNMGVRNFYIRLEDAREDSLESQYLQTQAQDVFVEYGNSEPNMDNFETLQDRQADFVNRMLGRAHDDGVFVLFHIDADELLDGNLWFLQDLDPAVKTLTFENIEAVYGNSPDAPDAPCFASQDFIRCADPEHGHLCTSYGNGKGAGIVAPGVLANGPHEFKFDEQIEGDFVYRVPFDVLRVRHYDSCSFEEWAKKFHNQKGNNSPTPFTYYNESVLAIQGASQVYDTYKKRDVSTLPPDSVFRV